MEYIVYNTCIIFKTWTVQAKAKAMKVQVWNWFYLPWLTSHPICCSCLSLQGRDTKMCLEWGVVIFFLWPHPMVLSPSSDSVLRCHCWWGLGTLRGARDQAASKASSPLTALLLQPQSLSFIENDERTHKVKFSKMKRNKAYSFIRWGHDKNLLSCTEGIGLRRREWNGRDSFLGDKAT